VKQSKKYREEATNVQAFVLDELIIANQAYLQK